MPYTEIRPTAALAPWVECFWINRDDASLFITVDDLDAAVAKLPPETDVFVPRRTTFYGATETFLRDAVGNVIILAQFGA